MSYVNHKVAIPRQNRLLALLPEDEWERVRPNLQPVKRKLGEVICESTGALADVYFPTTAIVSLMQVLADAGSAGIAVVGNDGIVGVSRFMGGGTTPSPAVVQSEGWAYRINAGLLLDEFSRGGELQRILLRYTQALITQVAQTAVCNRYHSIVQRLCRWLLLSLDQLPSADLWVTHDQIAYVLGVRREGVTEAAGQLQTDGLIRYRRGHVSVVDRLGLEARCCECYAVVKAETDRLLPQRVKPSVVTATRDHGTRVPNVGVGSPAAMAVSPTRPVPHATRTAGESVLSPGAKRGSLHCQSEEERHA